MKTSPQDEGPPPGASLRSRAESIVSRIANHQTAGTQAGAEGCPDDQTKILHELLIHQIELEMQNDELRAAQISLDAARARYFDLYDLAPIGYITVSQAGQIAEANLTAATLLGLPRGRLVNKPFSVTIHREDQDIYYLMAKKLAETGSPQSCELRLKKPGDTYFWARLDVSTNQTGGPEANLRISISDITERKLANEQLRESEHLLRESQTVAGLGTYVLQVQTGIWKSSEVMDQIFGINQEYPHTVKGWENLIHPDDRGWMSAYLQSEVLEKRMNFNMEYRILRPSDKAVRWVHGIGRLECDAGGRPVKMFGTIQDITWRKMAEEELKTKNADLERFTNAVSHDLKSPLVTIQTFLGFLETDLKNGNAENIPGNLAYIRGAADKMERLLEELLQLARAGAKKNTLETIPLGEIVREAQNLVAGQIAGSGAQVEVTSEPVLLFGDRARLVEIFQNLIDNAVKFRGADGPPRIEIGIERQDGEIVLFVRDHGQGLEADQLPKLFDPFEKLDEASPGSGMGLTIVRRIVERHGGTIIACSDGPGLGATFRLTLPHTRLLGPDS